IGLKDWLSPCILSNYTRRPVRGSLGFRSARVKSETPRHTECEQKDTLSLKYEVEWRYILALVSIPHPGSFLKAPMPLPKGEGRVNLILFPSPRGRGWSAGRRTG